MAKWYKLKDIKPGNEIQSYLVFVQKEQLKYVSVGHWYPDHGCFWDSVYGRERTGITHWMPLPELPEEESE